MMENKKVVVMSWGEPVIKNVIDINYKKKQVQVQSEGHGGSMWVDFDECMSQIEVDYFYIQKSSAEVNRLDIKKTILEWNQRDNLRK